MILLDYEKMNFFPSKFIIELLVSLLLVIRINTSGTWAVTGHFYVTYYEYHDSGD
jgi:hypothetical protein